MNAYKQFLQRRLIFQNPTTNEDVLGAFADEEEWLSVNQIANRVMRRPTPQLRARLKLMVYAGLLTQGEEQLANGYKKFWYRRVK